MCQPVVHLNYLREAHCAHVGTFHLVAVAVHCSSDARARRCQAALSPSEMVLSPLPNRSHSLHLLVDTPTEASAATALYLLIVAVGIALRNIRSGWRKAIGLCKKSASLLLALGTLLLLTATVRWIISARRYFSASNLGASLKCYFAVRFGAICLSLTTVSTHQQYPVEPLHCIGL